jgi:hypothetical protein
MAFRLRIDEPIAKGFRRIGVEQIERARRQLAAGADPATEIHEARKCLKRIRALLRLGREGLGEDVFRAENAEFRAIAALLAQARDDHVLVQTVVKLAAEDQGGDGSALARFKDAILAARTTGEATEETSSDRAEADAALERAQRRFRRLRLAPDSFATLEAGFVRNYRKGLACRERAYAAETDEAFHEWRKCVQSLWRHLALLSRAWPALFEVYIEAARELSQILGDDHDLALLGQKLAGLPPDALPAGDVREIAALIRARQAALRRAAEWRGAMIFAERPKAIGRRVAAVWDSAVRQRREGGREEKPASAKAPRAGAVAQQRG